MTASDRTITNRPRRSAMLRVAIAAILSVAALLLLGGLARSGDDQDAAEDAGDQAPATSKDFFDEGPETSVPPGTDYNQRASLLRRGRVVYDRYCVGCHGVDGKGEGPAAARLITKPRDFTSGIYKFRTTDSSSLPMEADLHRTITRGLARVSMPAFPQMPEQDKIAVIEYIKRFYPKWEEEKNLRQLVFVPLAPNDLHDDQRVGRGRVVYLAMMCGKCHGKDGAGTGRTQAEYTDAWGNPQQAFNFTRGRLKSGDDPEDIYRVFHTGLRSIMPSFAPADFADISKERVMAGQYFMEPGEMQELAKYLKDFPAQEDVSKMTHEEREVRARRNAWDLVAYILSLRRAGGKPTGPPAQIEQVSEPADGYGDGYGDGYE